MRKKIFKEFLDSIREAGAIRRGEVKPSRKMVVDVSDSGDQLISASELFESEDGRNQLLRLLEFENYMKNIHAK